ncbi:MAG: hypothetical protein JNN13_00410 [Planctomycetes bacterium]|nr:hypothetical protein [Planctomycetota bacterium]
MRRTLCLVSVGSLLPLLPLRAQAPQPVAGGTLGVAGRAATVDGRPLLWLVHEPRADLVVMALADGKLPYLALCEAAKLDRAFGGVNQAGFGIVVTAVDDLPAGAAGEDNGEFVKRALQSCALVAEFEALLRGSDAAGRRTRGNFAVIDAGGTAAVFEVGPKAFARYDAEAQGGVMVRTNGTSAGGTTGAERRARGEALLAGAAAKPLTTRFLLQEFVRDVTPLPGAAPDHDAERDDGGTLGSGAAGAALVLQGVKGGEDARLSTLWALLGPPLATVAVPLWPLAAATPRELAGEPRSRLADLAQRLADGMHTAPGADGAPPRLRLVPMAAVRRVVLFNEAKVLAQAEQALTTFRAAAKPPAPSLLRAAQERIAADAVKWVEELGEKVARPAGK